MHPAHHIPTTHLIDRVLMRGHPPVPLWSVWRSCSRAAPVPQEDETEEEEGSANPCQGGSQRGQSGPAVPLPWNWDTTGGTVLPKAGGDNTLLTGESHPSDLYRGIWHR